MKKYQIYLLIDEKKLEVLDMKDLMNLGKTENRKQVEYLNDIRDVGMSIVFGECDANNFSMVFEEYLDYVQKPSEYLQTIKEVYNMIYAGECTPDDLLLKMGKYTKTIEYEEPEIQCGIPVDELDELDLTEDELDARYGCCSLDDDDDDDIDIECIELSDEATEALLKILSKLSEE